MKIIKLLLSLIIFFSVFIFTPSVYARTKTLNPPALSISNFVKYKLSILQCERRAYEIMQQMNFDPQNYGEGTVTGYGEQSIVSVNCHQLKDSLFIQIVVASQRTEVADIIKNYLLDYLRGDTEKLSKSPCLEHSEH
ncbi:MAG: hypothetical protein WAX77_04810 [Methylococcaceae bacterium]